MIEKTIILPPASTGNGDDANYRLTVMVPKRRYFSCLRERWWVVLVCLVITVGAMLAYQTTRSEIYSSFAQLYLNGGVQIWVASVFSEDSQNYFGTQIELFKSPRLQSAAFDRAGIKLKPGDKNPYKVELTQPMKTSILVMQATGPDPAGVQRYLKALLDEYLAFKKDTRKTGTEDVLASLADELAKREADLKAEQEKWAEFQKTNNVAVLEDESKSTGQYLAELNLQVSKLKLERELLEQGFASSTAAAETTRLAKAAASTNLLPAATGTNLAPASSDTMLKSARVELAVLLAEKAAKTNQFPALHPYMRKLDNDIARTQETVSELEQQELAQKKNELNQLEKRIAATEAAIPSVEERVLRIDDKLSDTQRFKDNIQRQQLFYDHLLGLLQNVDLGKNAQQERLAVLQDATPGQPTEQNAALQIVLAVAGGLFLALGIVFVWYLLDDRFVSVRDIKDQFGEMVLGLVPQIRVPRSKPKTVLIEGNDSRSAYAECYRHLRSALLLSSLSESRPQTLLFTAAGPAEGKTSVAVNLARVMARSGLKVVLADMDAHGGGIHRLLGGEDEPGVLDFLRGEATAQAILQSTETPGLSLVPAGSCTEHAEGLFLGSQLDELMSELRKDKDFVILDGAPILAADDAALLVPHAEAVIMVVRPFYTRSRLVRQALEMLYQRKAKQVAIILNRARKDDLAGLYYARNGVPKTPKRQTKVTA